MGRFGAALMVAVGLVLVATALHAALPTPVAVRTYLAVDPGVPVPEAPFGYFGINHLARQVQCPDPGCRFTTWAFAGVVGVPCPDPWGVHAAQGSGVPLMLPVPTKDRFLYRYDDDGPNTWPFDPNTGPAGDLPLLYTRPFHPGPDPTGTGEDEVRFVADGLRPVRPPPDPGATEVRVRIVPPGVRKPSALAIPLTGGAPAPTTYDQYFTVPPALVPMVPPIDADADGWDYPILANPATARTQLWTIGFYSGPSAVAAPTVAPAGQDPADVYFALWYGTAPTTTPRPLGNLDSITPMPTIAEAMSNTAAGSHAFYAGLWVARSEEIAFAFSATICDPTDGYTGTTITFKTYSNCAYYPVVAADGSGNQNPVVTLTVGNPGVVPGSTPGTVRLTDAFMSPYLLLAGQTGVGRVEVQERIRLAPGGGPGGAWPVWRPYDVDPPALAGGTDPNGDPDDNDLLLDANGAVGGTTSLNPPYTDKSLFTQFMSSRERVALTGLEYDDPATPGDELLPPDVAKTPVVTSPAPPGTLVPPDTQTAATAFSVGNWVTAQTLRCPTCGARHTFPADANGYPHSGAPAGSICEYCGTPLTYNANLERPGADLGFAEYEAMTSLTPGFSRASLGPTAPLRMPFETVLFAPLMADLPLATVPAGPNAAVSIKVPRYQPPAAPYSGLMLAVERRDEQQRWYEPVAGGAHYNFTGLPGPARPGDVLYDDNGKWDAYFQCPDCGNKQAAAGACQNPLCPGHVICPEHLSLLPAGIPYCPFYSPDGDGPDLIVTINPGGPPGQIGVADVSAEEYDPFSLETSVGPVPGASLGPQTVSLGKVQPGAAGPVAPDDPLGADIFPKERSRPAEFTLLNVGNVPLPGVALSATSLVRTEIDDTASSFGLVQQSAAINPPELDYVNYTDAGTSALVNMAPPYADDEGGSPYYYTVGGVPPPRPTKLRVGSTVSAPAMPVGSGTPAGEYGAYLTVAGMSIPVRARVVESRAPATMNGLLSSEAGPSPYVEPTGELSLVFSSNTPGGAADASHSIYAATMAPLTAGTPGDAYYRSHNLAAAVMAALSPAGAATNVFHARPYAFLDNPWGPTTAWVYWHTRQRNPGTGAWNSFLSFYSPSIGGLGTPLFDSRQLKGGVVGIIPQESSNGGALHWLFWQAGEEGHQQVGFSPQVDPTVPSTMNDYWVHLTNARMGTADPQFITYADYSSTPAAAPNVTPGSVIRKPDSNPFVFTKDPWVFEYPDNRPLPAGGPPQFADTDHLLNVFYSAEVRRQGNSDICWSMFDAYAGAATTPLMTVPAQNYGKRAFPRQYGEVLRADGEYQVFEARHLDWVISAGFPSTSAVFDPVLTVGGIGVAWSGSNKGANYYDRKTGIIHIQPTNLPADPLTGGALKMEIDPSAGVVAFSRSLAVVFGGPVTVTLDYQPFTFRITTDGNNDDSPVAFTDAFSRLVVFWRRSHSVSEAPHMGATSIVYKTFSTSVQVLQPPITTAVTAVPPPTVTDSLNGVLWWNPSTIATLPFSVAIGYNSLTETHQVVGWSKEVVVPLDTVAAEGPIDVAQESYTMPGSGMTGVKYWLFWTSNRGYYAPATGSLAANGRSDIYYTTVCPTFNTDVPE